MESRRSVLIVESEPSEEKLMRQVITDSEIDCDVRIARDGEEACEILFDSDAKAPTLVLLELKLPKLDGFEVLTRIRESAKTKRLPVIIFSDSVKLDEVNRCFDLCANSFVRKGKNLELNDTRLKLLLYYWIAVNQNGNA